MSKHINTHLFFHMGGGDSSKGKGASSGGGGIGDSSSSSRKPKKSSNLFSGYEIDTNPPLPSETGDYYDYYTNYGIPENYGQPSPCASPPYYGGGGGEGGGGGGNPADQYYYDYSNTEQTPYYDNAYYGRDGENSADYRDNYPNYDTRTGGGGAYGQANSYPNHSGGGGANHHSGGGGSPYRADPYSQQQGQHHPQSQYHQPHPQAQTHLQPPLISPPIDHMKRASSSPSSFPGACAGASGDYNSSYRNELSQGLGAISHKLHRITFVEACIFQPPDLASPSSAGPRPPPGPPPPQAPPHGPPPPPPGAMRPLPMLAQGERSPTSTGGTQYYQEWTSKHMRHLCSRFEKPAQQQLLMNVERKSKYPFIILCTPEAPSSGLSRLNSSSSTSSGGGGARQAAYRRQASSHSYSLEGEVDDDVTEEERWITQKQRDSINSHYLPPPPPPIGQPHIWPEIKYVDGLYTVCAMIARPGSGVPDPEFDDTFYLGQDMGGAGPSGYENYQGGGYENNHHHHAQENPYERQMSSNSRHISFQDTARASSSGTSSSGGSHSGGGGAPGGPSANSRPAGYIVSAFATFPGEDSEKLEKNWLLWTGARILYKYLPMCVGLRRLIFLKRCPDMYREDMVQGKVKPTIFNGFTYVLLCECFNLKAEIIASVCTTIDQLRARCCGYSALYLTHYRPPRGGGGGHEGGELGQQHPGGGHPGVVHNNHAPSTSGHHQQQQQHQFHHVPRHHRSTDFSDFENH